MIVSFSHTLKELREARGFSQRQLADKIGVSPSMIGLYETGERMPSFETLLRIRRLFGVSADFLLGEEDSGFQSADLTGLTPDQIKAVSEILNNSAGRMDAERYSILFYFCVACTIIRIFGFPVMQVIIVIRLRPSSYRIR